MTDQHSETEQYVPSLAERWVAVYEEGHCSTGNRLLHYLCAPLLVVSIVALLWAIPVPEPMQVAGPIINWGTLLLMASVVYYFILSTYIALALLPYVVGIFVLVAWLDQQATPLWLTAGLIFVCASLGQIGGHLFEGGRGSLIRDVHYFAIAPVWVIASIYRRFGIRY